MSTITREFTKEQLIAAACSRIDFAKQTLRGNPLPLAKRKWEIELSLSEIALASLEAEPVAWRYRHHNGLAASNWKVVDSEGECNKAPNYQRQALYASPPAQVSVPEWTNEQCLEFLSIAFRHAEIKGDLELDDIRLGVKMVNGSRAAMLQGANGNSPVIPDGSTSAAQFVKDYCKAAGWTEKEFYETQVPLPDITSPSGWAAVSNSPLSIKSHVDLYMRAAPQQEVR